MINVGNPELLESWHTEEQKRRWEIIRTDDYTALPGEILTANAITGECCMAVGDVTKTYTLGPGGIRIIRKRR